MLYCLSLLLLCIFVFLFFFKQKTAYDMRISDWSSDVCSSDLTPLFFRRIHKWVGLILGLQFLLWALSGSVMALLDKDRVGGHGVGMSHRMAPWAISSERIKRSALLVAISTKSASANENLMRSEEHTSELQSLTRISYAVFCLKKKTAILRH